VSEPLDEVLRQAQDLGFIGPGSIEDARRHAERLCDLALEGLASEGLATEPGWSWIDLGSGGGLPGLVLAGRLPEGCTGTLLDSQRRRTHFLAEAVDRLGFADRIEVVTARAEDAGRDPSRRERYALVIARSFGSPAVTAECAVAFLRPGGRLVVSEPPEPDPRRWDAFGLAQLGLSAPDLVAEGETHAAVLHRIGPLDPRWPRKEGIPAKRPLW